MRFLYLVIPATILALSACASVRTTYAPDGRPAYALNCSGLARGWDKCQSAAGDICGAKGYDVLDRSDEASATATANASFAFGARTNERTMLIACK